MSKNWSPSRCRTDLRNPCLSRGLHYIGKKTQHFNSYRKKIKITKSKKNVKWDFRRFKHGLSAWSLKLWLETIIQITWICIHGSDQLLWMGWGHQDTPKALPQPSPGAKGVQSMHSFIYLFRHSHPPMICLWIPSQREKSLILSGGHRRRTPCSPQHLSHSTFLLQREKGGVVCLPEGKKREKKIQAPTLPFPKRLPRDSWVIFVQTQTIRSVLEGVSSTQHGKFHPK